MQEERFISLSEAANRSPGRPSANAVWRWCRKGVLSRSGRRIKLHHVRVGGRIFTDPQSLERFFSEVAEDDAAHFDRTVEERPQLRTGGSAQRQRQIEQAERELSEAGI